MSREHWVYHAMGFWWVRSTYSLDRFTTREGADEFRIKAFPWRAALSAPSPETPT